MNGRLASIQQHRAALVARAAAQRQEVREVFEVWRAPLSLAERALALYQRMRTSPFLVPAGALLLYGLRRTRKWPWARRLGMAWQLFSSFRRMRASPGG